MNNCHQTNIKLIEAVEKFPELWDSSNEKYANKLHAEKVWSEIAKEMNTTGANCRVRWGTLRGNFSRALKPTSSGSIPKTKKEYYLSPYLKFLLPFMKSRPSNGNISLDASQSELLVESGMNETVQKNDENDVSMERSFMYQEERGTPNILMKNNYPRNSNDTLDASVISYIANEKQKGNPMDFDQANLNFFKSLLPYMAKLDPRTSNEFKMSIMGQLNDLLYGVDPSNTSLKIANNTSQGYSSYTEQYINQSMYRV